MTQRSVMEKIAEIRGRINPHYDMTVPEINEIYESASDPYDGICHGFWYGYMQGVKVGRKEKTGNGKTRHLSERDEYISRILADLKKIKDLDQIIIFMQYLKNEVEREGAGK